MAENQQNPTSYKNIRQFNRQCAQQRHKLTHTPLNNHHKRVHNYLIDTSYVLGQGTFSTVYKGKDIRSSKDVAVKVIEISKIKQTGIQHLFKEQINIIQSLNHPNIVACLQYFRTVNNCYTVYQYCEGGDLASLLQKTHFNNSDLRQVNTYIKDVFQGLLYLQSQNVVHRDIKAANVFLEKGCAKIGDFGFATRCNSQFKDASIGSPAYMAPEGLIHHIYGPKTDIWAFGMLIYEMLHGNSPFYECQSQNELKARIKIPINWDQLKTNLPSALKRLILKCLRVEAKQRPSFSELLNDEYMVRIYSEMSITRVNTKSNYSSRTSDTQKINRSAETMRVSSLHHQKQEQMQQVARQLAANGRQVDYEGQLGNGEEISNGQLLSASRQDMLQSRQCEQLPRQQPNECAARDHAVTPQPKQQQQEVKQEPIAEQVYQEVLFLDRVKEQDIIMMRYMMPCIQLSQLCSILDVLVTTATISMQLSLQPSNLLPFYAVTDQLINEVHYLIKQHQAKQYIKQYHQRVCSSTYQFYSSLHKFNFKLQPALSCVQSVQSVFQLIKQIQMMIDKQGMSLSLQHQSSLLHEPKAGSKLLIMLGNYLIHSYHLLNSLKTNQFIQPHHYQLEMEKVQSSEQFYIWLYELQLARMDQL